ncbi:MAG: DUF2007 domain-containing protein [Rikenellaceae bacterium]
MSEIKYDATQDEMVVFREFASVNEAEVVRSVLESAGIQSTLGNEYMSAFYPVGVIYAQIIIRREDLERAKAVVSL